MRPPAQSTLRSWHVADGQHTHIHFEAVQRSDQFGHYPYLRPLLGQCVRV